MREGRQPLFILGFARSGTTLLQRLLNSYDDVLIWGEHVGFLRDVANAYARVWRNPDYFKSTVPLAEVLQDTRPLTRWQAWMNWTTPDDWRRLYREFVESVFLPEGLPGRRVWGWKEVHYVGARNDHTLPFLAEIFPDARFVFLVRNGFDTMASFGVWPFRRSLAAWQQEGCVAWVRAMRTFRRWHESGRIDSYWLRYEDLIETRGELLRLLESLGKTLGDEQNAVLRADSARGSSFTGVPDGDRWKRLSSARQGLAHVCLASTNTMLGYDNPRVPLTARVLGRIAWPVLTAAYHGAGLARRAREVLRAGSAHGNDRLTAPPAGKSASPDPQSPRAPAHAANAGPSTTQSR